MKIIFLGTPALANNVLHILNKYHKILVVCTQPDTQKKRSGKLTPSDVCIECEKLSLPVIKVDRITEELIQNLKNLNADIFITFAFGLILPKEFLTITPFGGINIHPSLLPELRGPSPIQTAILLGKKKSGITIQKIDLKVDSGDILLQKEFDILDNDDAYTIEEKVSNLAPEMIIEVLKMFEENRLNPISQDNSKATYCKLIKKEDGLINWNNSCDSIINKIRAFVKWPVAFTFLDNKRINIYKASKNNLIDFNNYKNETDGKIIFADKNRGLIVKCSDSLINIERIQLQGKNILNWLDFINGYRDLCNKIFNNGDDINGIF